ncbi:hypothetical protein [Leptolyngbya sp. 7M]|uniref:hypothetical protein n=1 Tax=Leptolyngbya sp. 7M TaxID=2812896 RepID=UPI001B8B2E0E|nr:hypothetical protein [Leptolyngbya sp. 7M]QYO66687.1 hypothetical protein JVX88_07760 [Leptolyngbya sp. 7M]
MANSDQNSTEAAMNAYMRQVEQFKEGGGERSNRVLEGLRNQSGLSEERAKLIENHVFSRERNPFTTDGRSPSSQDGGFDAPLGIDWNEGPDGF